MISLQTESALRGRLGSGASTDGFSFFTVGSDDDCGDFVEIFPTPLGVIFNMQS